MTDTPLCGSCKKPKGEGEGFCTCGRPTEYKEEYIEKAKEYLSLHQDQELDKKLKVKLPSVEGFARFLGHNEDTLNEWSKIYPQFSVAIKEIKTEQKERLVNKGLSNDYNPTIAKLLLSANHGMSEQTKIDHTTGGKEMTNLTERQENAVQSLASIFKK